MSTHPSTSFPASLSKPHLHLQRQLDYQKHLRRIDSIIKGRSHPPINPLPLPPHSHSTLSPLRSNKHSYDKLSRLRISEENSRIVQRLQNINRKSRKREESYSLCGKNRSRRGEEQRQRQREIAIENARMAERLIARHSDIEERKRRILRGIEEYEDLRGMMRRNRRVLGGSGRSGEMK